MSAELKQAAQQAVDAFDVFSDADDFVSLYALTQKMRALRTTIQQPEPVVDVRCEGCGYMTHHREHMGCVRAAKQHTHPAPSVPDGYVLVPIEPTQAMMNVQTWDFSSFYSPREIWAARLAAKQEGGA